MTKRAVILSLLATTSFALGQAVSTNALTPPVPTNEPGVQIIPAGSRQIVTGTPPPATRNVRAMPAVPSNYRPLPDGMLAWNGVTQEDSVKSGTPQAHFEFSVTNVSDKAITVSSVRTSCGCTVPKLPPMPWTLEPGTNGTIEVTMNLAGKRGDVTKTVTVTTDEGFKTLYVRTHIAEEAPGVMGESDRIRNLQIATANRQAVFQGDCASCHATPALNKTGAELYDNACGICHEAEHRASMVPDLKNLNKETNADYWRTWITTSMDGKLMPAFAIEHGGILNAMQINSLVDYLLESMPPGTTPTPASSAPPSGH